MKWREIALDPKKSGRGLLPLSNELQLQPDRMRNSAGLRLNASLLNTLKQLHLSLTELLSGLCVIAVIFISVYVFEELRSLGRGVRTLEI